MKKNESKENGYDAFISYHRVPLNIKVAQKLQELLESPRLLRLARHALQSDFSTGSRQRDALSASASGKNRLHIFLDQGELSASSHLTEDIRDALRRSRYLIVVCAKDLKESEWCMEEIRMFRQLHSGNTDKILTLLVNGEPGPILSQLPLWDVHPQADTDGRTVNDKKVSDMLGADVRAKSTRKILRKLKTEYLRLAAPILGCDYDALYRRDQRRQRKTVITVLSGTALLLTAVLAVVSVFAYRTWVSENNYRTMLVDNYTQEANRYVRAKNPQEALLYYASALSLDPEKMPSATGAALLLQDYLWPALREKGAAKAAEEESSLAHDIPGSDEMSPGCAADEDFLDFGASARELADGTMIVAHNGLVHLYSFDDSGDASELARADLADAFPYDASKNGLARTNEVCVSADGSLALVNSYSLAALYDTETLNLKTTVMRYLDFLQGMAISPDNRYFGLSYGTNYQDNLLNPGGHFEIYSTDGELLFSSPQNSKESLLGISFHPSDPDVVLVWSSGFVHVWNWQEGREIMAPICAANIRSAEFSDDGASVSVSDRQNAFVYSLEKFACTAPAFDPAADLSAVPTGHYYMDAEGPDGMSLSLGVSALTMSDADGRERAKIDLPGYGERLALSKDFRTAYLYNTNAAALMTLPVDLENGKFGDILQLDTEEEPTLEIWFDDGWLAAELTSRNLLIFDADGNRIGKILPQHEGNIASVLIDPALQYLVLILKNTTSAADSFHYDKTGIAEIWDISSGLPLASYETTGKEIDSAWLTPDGTLCFCTAKTSFAKRLAVPAPDEEAVRFLQQLCALDFDSGQNLISKTPSCSRQMGNWNFLDSSTIRDSGTDGTPDTDTSDADIPDSEILADATPNTGADASEDSLTSLVDAMRGTDNSDSDAWFAECDALWQRLCDGELPYTAQELDYFYRYYNNTAENLGQTEHMSAGVNAYISLTMRLIDPEDGSESEDTVMSNSYAELMKTLSATQEYDSVIAAFFSEAAALDEESADTPPSDDDILARLDALSFAYIKRYLNAWAAYLNGSGGAEAMMSAASFCDSDPLIESLKPEPLALAQLMSGNSAAAADTINQWLRDASYRFSPDDADAVEQYLEMLLLGGEILTWREQIDASVYEEYLEAIDADFGMEVFEASPEAQKAGIQPKDLITRIDGRRITCPAQYRRLRSLPGAESLTILRGEETVTIPLSENASFYGRMKVRLRGQ